MAFLKKVVILKELENGFALKGKKISGIVRIEQTDGVSELYLSTINVGALSGGSFFLFVIDCSKTVYAFDLSTRPYSYGKVFDGSPDIENGFSAGLCFVKDDLPITIAFGVLEKCPVTLSEFKRLVAETCLNLRRKNQREKQELQERESFQSQCAKPKVCSSESSASPNCSSYDDEAVATENYYALEDSINDKLLQVKESENARLSNENAMPFVSCQKETEKSQSPNYCNQDEASSCDCPKYSPSTPYYLTVKAELEEIFKKFPQDKQLSALFADSRWARVNYSSEKYYVVGLIKEDGKEKYICYGVPEKYSIEPPEPLKDCATFIPLSIFDLKGQGYWMMFQDAVTGNSIKLKPR